MEKIYNNIMGWVDKIWAIPLVPFLVYLGLAFLAGFLASLFVKLILKGLKLDKKLDKWGVNEGQTGTSLKFIGKFVFIIVFLMILPTALQSLGIGGLTKPITDFTSVFVEYLPNIIAAIIVIYVGVLIAQILGQLVSVLLKKTKIDNLLHYEEGAERKILLSDIVVKIMMAAIILVTLTQAFLVLQIEAIAKPALAIVNAIFGAIPSIILAAAVVGCGILVAAIACGLLSNVLVAVNFDTLVKKFLPQLKFSATKVVVNVVRTFIILFVAAQGVEVLNLAILTNIAVALIGYVPMLIKAFVIFAAAFIGVCVLENVITKNAPKAARMITLVKVAIYSLAGVMILSQLGIATEIVNPAFIIILAAVGIAFALAFGLGGKDFAKKTLDKVDDKIEKCKAEFKAAEAEAESEPVVVEVEAEADVTVEAEAPAEEAPAEEAEAPAEEAPAEEAEAPAEEAPAEEAEAPTEEAPADAE